MLGYSTDSTMIYAGVDSIEFLTPKRLLAFENAIHDFADKSGAEKEYYRTGRITDEYRRFESETYRSIFGKDQRETQVYLHGDLNRDSVYYLTSPSVGPSADNSTSGVYFEQESIAVLYDDPFYRSRIIVLEGRRSKEVKLEDVLDFARDRTSGILIY